MTTTNASRHLLSTDKPYNHDLHVIDPITISPPEYLDEFNAVYISESNIWTHYI